MKKIDIRSFREVNGLTQKRIAEYLGVSKSYVSQAEAGHARLSQEHIAMLLENLEDWNTSAITDVLPPESVVQNNQNGDNIHAGVYEAQSEQIESLMGIIREQQAQLSQSQSQMGELIALIRELRQRQ